MKETIIINVEYLGSRNKIARKIEISEDQTLDDLHHAIIYKAFRGDLLK